MDEKWILSHFQEIAMDPNTKKETRDLIIERHMGELKGSFPNPEKYKKIFDALLEIGKKYSKDKIHAFLSKSISELRVPPSSAEEQSICEIVFQDVVIYPEKYSDAAIKKIFDYLAHERKSEAYQDDWVLSVVKDKKRDVIFRIDLMESYFTYVPIEEDSTRERNISLPFSAVNQRRFIHSIILDSSLEKSLRERALWLLIQRFSVPFPENPVYALALDEALDPDLRLRIGKHMHFQMTELGIRNRQAVYHNAYLLATSRFPEITPEFAVDLLEHIPLGRGHVEKQSSYAEALVEIAVSTEDPKLALRILDIIFSKRSHGYLHEDPANQLLFRIIAKKPELVPRLIEKLKETGALNFHNYVMEIAKIIPKEKTGPVVDLFIEALNSKDNNTVSSVLTHIHALIHNNLVESSSQIRLLEALAKVCQNRGINMSWREHAGCTIVEASNTSWFIGSVRKRAKELARQIPFRLEC